MNIIFSVSQRRKKNVDGTQTVIQIFSEFSFSIASNKLTLVADNSYIGLLNLWRTYFYKFAIFQYASNLTWVVSGSLPRLENGSAVRYFKITFTGSCRSCKSAFSSKSSLSIVPSGTTVYGNVLPCFLWERECMILEYFLSDTTLTHNQTEMSVGQLEWLFYRAIKLRFITDNLKSLFYCLNCIHIF
jgi:hypothetical protein